ncbi:hypothetical protein P3X46_032490 [Hevea brasiliensis]|uniref:Cyclic nucleotide-binding domain-containing protein n=1 Tax=Hevea brasiliensis TaxID=3981 RepID=A0ABQ9KGD3_HEVBR|nr:hypothetical protein P3X46_032490 [Hevea brasiliensis]
MNRFIPNPNSKFRHLQRFREHLISPSLSASSTTADAYPLLILWRYQILDPDSDIVTYWNYVFLITSIIALFIDPLFFFLPYVGADGVCLSNDNRLAILITYFRSIANAFFSLHILMKFRTAFVAPSSRVFGWDELVMDSREIAMRYLKSDFFVIWVVIPAARNNSADHTNSALSLIVLIQYIPRIFVVFPLHQRIVKTTGFVAKTAWAGAAYNLLLYMLASHTLGASWYLLSLGRQFYCWKSECLKENKSGTLGCIEPFLDCSSLGKFERQYWRNVTHVPANCDPNDSNILFHFGIFSGAFTNDVATSPFINKYLYCLWWGLRNLSSYAQTLETSTFVGENIFCIITCILGLVLSAQLIGNMQTNLQSMTVRVEEWRIKRRDTEEWMRHRQLPPDLQERVRRFVQYKWLATRGVPFFSQMDEQLLDAICERLVSSLSTQGTYIFQEGDPANEMLFIIRGQLESSTTNGGRSGFFNSITLRPGDFCGEELLTWALMPNSSGNLPSSTRTVRALSDVEAFALQAEELKFQEATACFRHYSHQWRTWAACLIQSVWRRCQKRRMAKELAARESLAYISIPEERYYHCNELADGDYGNVSGERLSIDDANNVQHLEATILALKFAANTRRGTHQEVKVDSASSSLKMPQLFKPDEPDFSVDREDV